VLSVDCSCVVGREQCEEQFVLASGTKMEECAGENASIFVGEQAGMKSLALAARCQVFAARQTRQSQWRGDRLKDSIFCGNVFLFPLGCN
jgi:hypothetical protein